MRLVRGSSWMWAQAFIAVSSLSVLVPVEAADLRERKPVTSDPSQEGQARSGGSKVPQIALAGTSVLVLDLGTNEILRTERPARTVLVGSSDVLEASAINEKTIALTAKAAGSTNLIILDEDGVEFFRRTVQVGPPPEPPSPPPEPAPPPPPPQKPIVVYSGETVRTYLCQPTCNLPPDAAPTTSVTPQ
jgi:hypothetical protein